MNRRVLSVVVVVASAIALWIFELCGFADAATTYYVRIDGSDECNGTGDAGGSLGNCAFRTIGKSASVVDAGDTVNIRPGTYNEDVAISRSGSLGFPISFIGEGQIYSVEIGGNYVIVDGLTFTPDSGNAVTISGHDNIVRNTTILNQSNYNNAFETRSGSYNNLITGNTVRDCDNIDVMKVWGHDNTISYNTVTNIQCTDIANIHCDFVQTFGCPGDDSYNIVLDGNYIHDSEIQPFMLAEIGGYNGHYCELPEIQNAHHWTFQNNIFANLAGSGFVKIPFSYFFNNVFYGVGPGNGFSLYISKDIEGDGETGSRVYNNVFLSPGTLPYASASGANYSAGGGNPGFVNLSNQDFRLAGGSQLIDAGADLSAYFNIDKDHNVREKGAWDIGAYEYGHRLAPPRNLRVVR